MSAPPIVVTLSSDSADPADHLSVTVREIPPPRWCEQRPVWTAHASAGSAGAWRATGPTAQEAAAAAITAALEARDAGGWAGLPKYRAPEPDYSRAGQLRREGYDPDRLREYSRSTGKPDPFTLPPDRWVAYCEKLRALPPEQRAPFLLTPSEATP